jgi:hypothetical protein
MFPNKIYSVVKQSTKALCFFILGIPALLSGETVDVFYDAAAPQESFAAGDVATALVSKGYTVVSKPLSLLASTSGNMKVVIGLASNSAVTSALTAQGGAAPGTLGEQAYALRTTTTPQKSYWVLGGDANGAMYGGLAIAENITTYGLTNAYNLQEAPYILSRGTKSNLPLDKRCPTYHGPGAGSGFGGKAAQKALANVWDINYWKEWFDEMARSRYNVLTIWTCHPFTALGLPMAESFTDVQLYDGSIIPMTLAQKVAFWKEVMAYGKGRGFQIYFVTWSIYTDGTSLSTSPTDQATKDYMRKAVRLMFETYPDLTGLGASAGENMSGMSTDAKVQWVADTYGKGIEDYAKVHPERKIVFLQRFLDVSASTVKSKFSGMLAYTNVHLDMTYKYSVAHLYSTPDPQWIEIKDGENSIADLDAAGLKTWLELRNEDFFFLSWGDPQFVRDCIAGFPDKNRYISGFMYGSDGWSYTKDFTSKSAPFKNMLEIKRDWFLYRLWGRLSYNPLTPNQVFINEMASRYPGVDVQALFDAWTGASRGVPLAAELVMGSKNADASEGYFWWDFNWYPELCQSQYGFLNISDFIRAKPAEGSTMYSIQNSASGTFSGASRTSYSVADTIEVAATDALQKISSLDTKGFTDLALYKKNIKAQSYLSLYYAEKIRGATYKSANNTANAQTAMGKAYCHWINYTTLMNELHTGSSMERTRGFSNWSVHNSNVLGEYQALGGTGIPSCEQTGGPTVTVSATGASAAEPATHGSFTFTRTGATTAALTVDFGVTGTASSVTDYTTIGTSVYFAIGQTSVVVPVTVIPDIIVETGGETVMVNLVSSMDYTIGAPSTATVTIADDIGSDVAAISSWTSGTLNTKVSGSNRLMTVMVMGESSSDFTASSVTYGGQPMYRQTERLYPDGSRTYVALFTLNEQGVNAATSGEIAVNWSAPPSSGFSIYSVLLANVDQTTPVSVVVQNALTGSVVETSSALAAASGDMVILCGATATNNTISFTNGFTQRFESNAGWGDGTGGYKAGTGQSERPRFSQSGSGRMVICAMVVKKAADDKTYATWAVGYGLSAGSGAEDPDGDGLRNLAEYALGFSPLAPSASNSQALKIEAGQYVFRFTKAIPTADVTFTVEVSTDMVSWSPAPNAPVIESSTLTTQTMITTIPVIGSRCFARLKVTQP